MSGVEAVAVLGVISSVIAIIDGIKKAYEAVSDAQGLPEAFREVGVRLPFVERILASAEIHFEKTATDTDSLEAARKLLESCKIKLQRLNELFKKVVPTDGASRADRYLSAARTLGKGSRVESLMSGILVDIRLLADDYNLTPSKEKDELAKAVQEIAALKPSIPEYAFDSAGWVSLPLFDFQTFPPLILRRMALMKSDPLEFKDRGLNACLRILFQALRSDPRDDRYKLIDRKGARVNGTCTWITSNEVFQSWIGSPSQLLWLSGGPGKGKTMLSIYLAELLGQKAQDSAASLCLEFFCDNKDETRSTATKIVEGLVFQLLQLKPSLFNHASETFDVQRASLFSELSFESLWRVFTAMIYDRSLGNIYCILDGLDECSHDSLENLLRKVRALFANCRDGSKSCHLSLIIVSRDLPDFFPELLKSFLNISLDADVENNVEKDVHGFIDVKVDELSNHRQYSEALRSKVLKTLRERAQGTFLWVGIATSILKRCKMTEVEPALHSFPLGLEDLYTRLLLQIEPIQRETTARILRWVVLAQRPLTLCELSAAIDSDTRTLSISDQEEIVRDQISHCGHLLTLQNDQVNIIHQSAKDYLLRKELESNPELKLFRVHERDGNLKIARMCFYYVQNSPLGNSVYDLNNYEHHLERFPFLDYAILYWDDHARCLASSDDIFDLSLPFYKKNSKTRELWFQIYRLRVEQNQPPDWTKLLHWACYLGIAPLVENILHPKGVIDKVKILRHLNEQDSNGMTALLWAVTQEHEAVIRLLLKKRPHLEAKETGMNSTALMQAIWKGRTSIVDLLLQSGANVNVQDDEKWTCLSIASFDGHLEIAQLLLDKGANYNTMDMNGFAAIHNAAMKGHAAVVELLIARGADVQAKTSGKKSTALHLAAWNGRVEVVELLLRKGLNVDVRDRWQATALHIAAERGHWVVVRILLEQGADIQTSE